MAETQTKNFAFIDFHNTDGTTKKLHGFAIDWVKLFKFLKDKWKCEKAFLYIGVDEGDTDTTNLLETLRSDGCIVRDKTVFAYKNKDKEIKTTCPSCGHGFIERVDMGYNRKSNCDVDLTVDAIMSAGPESRFYIFTGDGDFQPLINYVIEKGAKVFIVSSAKKIRSSPRYYTSRYSTRLRELFREQNSNIHFIEINNLRFKIEKK